VSAGVYGWPFEDAVDAQVTTLAGTPTRVSRSVLVGYGRRAYAALTAAVARQAG
jgi:O-acetyl-ADP-ribose deacetylase